MLATVAAGSLALRLTALDMTLGSVAGVLLCLAGWAVVVLLTARPRPAIVPLGDAGER